jgi:pimeloyl-ACP methyl ester carboxylesterase
VAGIDSERLTFRGAAGELVGDRWGADGPQGHILMLHGGGQTRHSWDRAARSLAAQGWEVFTLDARGHGESTWATDGDYSVEALVADLFLVVDQVQSLRGSDAAPVVIGASMGGMTSLVAQGEHGNLARALVLVDIVPRVEMDGVERIGAFMRSAPTGFSSLEEVADAVSAYQPHRDRPRNIEGLRRNVRLAEDGRLYWHWDPAFHRIGEDLDLDPRGHHQRLADAARRIDVPTLLVRGALSDIVSEEGVAELLELIPGATAIDVAGAAHMVAGDDNAVFVEQTEEFLRSL